MASMEMSLDDIIAARPKTSHHPSQRGKGRAQILGTGGRVSPATKARAKATIAAKPAAAQTAQPHAEKIIVSNLPSDVNENQVKELFQTTVGQLREVTLHYDSNGRSKGVATVVFNKKGDGNRAHAQYNNRLIDGRRPMKIEIVMDPTKAAPPPSLASRVAPAPAANGAANAARTAASTRGRGGRRGRGGGRPKAAERTPKTAADLDAEMEDYTAASTNAAAAPAATA
uniref:RRM domain-containing protein n=1 Tax=Mycena chlorophos TaxID=658473 RepID=A0ABQ0LKD6_MYCCL|nr:predicted protein [Mycena chlorophos]